MENNKLKKPFHSGRDHVDTAGSYQLFMIIAGKSGIFCGYPQTCHHHVLPHLLPSVTREG